MLLTGQGGPGRPDRFALSVGRRASGRVAVRLRPVRSLRGPAPADVPAQRLRPLRDERRGLGVDGRLVRRVLLRDEPGPRPDRPAGGPHSCPPRRFLGRLRRRRHRLLPHGAREPELARWELEPAPRTESRVSTLPDRGRWLVRSVRLRGQTAHPTVLRANRPPAGFEGNRSGLDECAQRDRPPPPGRPSLRRRDALKTPGSGAEPWMEYHCLMCFFSDLGRREERQFVRLSVPRFGTGLLGFTMPW
jgi:hypothetical protein